MLEETSVVTTDSSDDPALIAPTTVVEAPDNTHDLNQYQLELLREIKSLYETHNSNTSQRIAELEGKLAEVCARLDNQKPPSEEARDEALEDIAEVGDVISDLAEAIIPEPGVDNIVTEPQAPTTISTSDDSGTEADTIVESDIGTTGSASTAPPANRRNGRRRIAGIPW